MKKVMKEIRTRRSVRSYLPTPVTKEEMAAILEAGNLAPTGRNAQNLLFVGIVDEDRIARVKSFPGWRERILWRTVHRLSLRTERRQPHGSKRRRRHGEHDASGHVHGSFKLLDPLHRRPFRDAGGEKSPFRGLRAGRGLSSCRDACARTCGGNICRQGKG